MSRFLVLASLLFPFVGHANVVGTPAAPDCALVISDSQDEARAFSPHLATPAWASQSLTLNFNLTTAKVSHAGNVALICDYGADKCWAYSGITGNWTATPAGGSFPNIQSTDRYYADENIALVEADGADQIWGFSAVTDEWKQQTNTNHSSSDPIIYENNVGMLCVPGSDKCYAFTPDDGTGAAAWVSLSASGLATTDWMTCGDRLCVVGVDSTDTLYALSTASGASSSWKTFNAAGYDSTSAETIMTNAAVVVDYDGDKGWAFSSDNDAWATEKVLTGVDTSATLAGSGRVFVIADYDDDKIWGYSADANGWSSVTATSLASSDYVAADYDVAVVAVYSATKAYGFTSWPAGALSPISNTTITGLDSTDLIDHSSHCVLIAEYANDDLYGYGINYGWKSLDTPSGTLSSSDHHAVTLSCAVVTSTGNDKIYGFTGDTSTGWYQQDLNGNTNTIDKWGCGGDECFVEDYTADYIYGFRAGGAWHSQLASGLTETPFAANLTQFGQEVGTTLYAFSYSPTGANPYYRTVSLAGAANVYAGWYNTLMACGSGIDICYAVSANNNADVSETFTDLQLGDHIGVGAYFGWVALFNDDRIDAWSSTDETWHSQNFTIASTDYVSP